MIYFLYLASIAFSVFGLFFKGSSWFIWLLSGIFLFLAFFFEAKNWFKKRAVLKQQRKEREPLRDERRNDVRDKNSYERVADNRAGVLLVEKSLDKRKTGANLADFYFQRGIEDISIDNNNFDSEIKEGMINRAKEMNYTLYVFDSSPNYLEGNSLLFSNKGNRAVSGERVEDKEAFTKLFLDCVNQIKVSTPAQNTANSDMFNIKCTVKGDIYENQIAELLKKACGVFEEINHYGLDVSSLEVVPRGLRTKYDGGIDISFSVCDKRGNRKKGAIQCKNWDSLYEVENEEISRFLQKVSEFDRDFVHGFFICNIPDTVSDTDRRAFKNINFLTIPSEVREKRDRDGAIDDLINQISLEGKRDFGADFSRALIHTRMYEIKNGE